MSWFPDIHSKKLPGNACRIYNNKPVSMYQLATFDVLSSPASRFPLPLMYEIMRKMRKETAGRQIRITNELGTDLVVKAPTLERLFGGVGVGLEEVGPLKRGVRAHFPPSTTGFLPVEADGIFVPNETIVTGAPSHPIKVTVEGGYVTNIEGEGEAEALKAFVTGPGRDPSPKRLVECMWGLNPKARISGANATMVEKERHAGTLHLGIATYNRLESSGGPGPGGWASHVDCYVETPSMWFDGELMVDKRRLLLLEDPEIRRLAKQFGDVEALLRPRQPLDNITC
jgi:leucyl aminopeptidase (aminopeptidase T)